MSPQQCRAARALIGLSRPQLSVVAHVSKNTIEAFESGRHQPSRSTISKLRAAFSGLAVRFTDGDEGVGVLRHRTLSEMQDRDSFLDCPDPFPPAEIECEDAVPLTPEQARAARALVDMSQLEAARAATVGLSLLVSLETGGRIPRPRNARKVRAMYEARGVVFTQIRGMPAIQMLARARPYRSTSAVDSYEGADRDAAG